MLYFKYGIIKSFMNRGQLDEAKLEYFYEPVSDYPIQALIRSGIKPHELYIVEKGYGFGEKILAQDNGKGLISLYTLSDLRQWKINYTTGVLEKL